MRFIVKESNNMKLQEGVYPDFYEDYPQIIKEKTDLFIGRKMWLEEQWNDICRMVNGEEVHNLAFLAHRKSGKTAFLAKFYNLAFYRQREVIPFYYEFPNNKRNGKKVAREILESLICQATDFLLGESYYIKEGLFQECLDKLDEIKHKRGWAKNILQRYDAYLKTEDEIPDYRCHELLHQVWKFVHAIDDKPAVLIVDEAQEMARSLFGTDPNTGKQVIVPCQLSVSSIYNKQEIWIVFSGSRVSELYYNMVGALANRMFKEYFALLTREESDKLISELLKKYDYEVYSKIFDDIWDITQGHPFYIQTIFNPNSRDYMRVVNKPKSFKTHEELKEVLYFEAAYMKGKLYQFWDNHFVENIKCLDDKDKKEKDLTLQILYYVASNTKENIPYSEIKKKFGLESVDKKIRQLIDADLVQIEEQSRVVRKLNDNLLSLFLAKKYSEEIFGENFQKPIEEQLDKLMARLVNKKFASLEKLVDQQGKDLEQIKQDSESYTIKLTTIDQKINKMNGRLNFHLGQLQQNEITKKVQDAIEKGQGIFAGIKLLEELKSMEVYDDKQKKQHKMDACAVVEIEGEKVGLIIEIKNHANPIKTSFIKNYLNATTPILQRLGCDKAMCVYISESGFYKPAKVLLEANNVAFGDISSLMEKENVVIANSNSKTEITSTKKTKTKTTKTGTNKTKPKKKTQSKSKATKTSTNSQSKKRKNKSA